jgi:hypothetical protein
MPNARRTDPSTSHAAAASVNNITETQRAIYMLLLAGESGLTDPAGWKIYQMAAENKIAPIISESGYRSRRAELVRLGFVKDTGDREKLSSGRSAIVWSAIPRKKSFFGLHF